MARRWRSSEWLEFIFQFRRHDVGQERDDFLRASFPEGGTSDLLDALLWRIEQPGELFRHDFAHATVGAGAGAGAGAAGGDGETAASVHPAALKINLLLFLQEQIFSLVHDAATIEQG